jgi:hypothetical protein
MFAATPTIVSSCHTRCSFADSRCPTTAWPGKWCRANASFTIATSGAPRLSEATNARPEAIRTRSAVK